MSDPTIPNNILSNAMAGDCETEILLILINKHIHLLLLSDKCSLNKIIF
jgi:hypothetical protein